MDDSTVKLVVGILGAIAIIIVIGCIVISILGHDIPAALIGLGGTAIGAIGGILTNSGGTRGDQSTVTLKE